MCPCPLQSAFFNSCMETGKDVYNGGCAPHVILQMPIAGAANVGDSLAAVKKVVFDEKKITMEQLINALDADFEGYEEIQHLLERGA